LGLNFCVTLIKVSLFLNYFFQLLLLGIDLLVDEPRIVFALEEQQGIRQELPLQTLTSAIILAMASPSWSSPSAAALSFAKSSFSVFNAS